MDREKIKEYYKSCNVYSIESIIKFKSTDGEKNTSYFRNTGYEREKLFNNIIDENTFFDLKTKKRLKEENRLCTFLYEHIVRFYDAVCNYEKALRENEINKAASYTNNINLRFYDIKHTFANLEYQRLYIRSLVNDEKYKTAIKVRYLCLQMLENLLLHFKQWLNMDLLNSPFKHLFNAHLEMLKTSINTDEINLIVNIGDIVKTEKQEPQHETVINKEEILNGINNLISNVNIEDVYDYFEILTKSTNKNNEYYLTEKQLLNFIKATFIDLKPIPQEFCGKPNNKKDVRSLFFRFYEQCSIYDYKAKHKKEKYFNIMFETFGYFFDKAKDFDEWNKTNQKIIGKKITNKPKI